MKGSLSDFQNRLAASLAKGTLLVWIAFAIIFQALVYELHKSETRLASNQFSSAIHAYLSLVESRVALVANNPDFRAFIRSGATSRGELGGAVVESLASLRRDEVIGVSLREKATDAEIVAIGQSSATQLAIDLCYLGDNLSPQFGVCGTTLFLNIQRNVFLDNVFQSLEIRRVCENCGKKVAEIPRQSDFVKISPQSTLTVDAEPLRGSIFRIETYFFFLSLLVLGYGAWMRKSIGKAIQESIIQPLNTLIASIKSGENKPFSASDSFSEIISIQNHHAAAAAIANMTQMVAHDVRKPFSSVKSALTILSHASTIEDVRENMKVIGPSIEESLTAVNGMLDDIMEIGRVEKPITETVSLLKIVEASLKEIFLAHQSTDITLRYRFRHKHALNVEAAKIQRVISNIAGNAIQAMRNKGEIWFESSELPNGFVEIKIGNTGPLIPLADLPKLFDAFYSKGKKGGTGLGLAIAKKVVLAHGGQIHCTYTADNQFVEFIFTLPASATTENQSANALPSHSQELAAPIQEVPPKLRTTGSIIVRDPRESQFESHLIEISKNLGRPLVVAVLDDEPLYRTAIYGLVGKDPDLNSAVTMKLFAGSTELLGTFAGTEGPDCVVCDIDLAKSDPMDGFAVVAKLRKMGFGGGICVHSNRFSAEDSRKSLSAGADLMLPKPMSRAHLLSFMASAFPAKMKSESEDVFREERPLVVVLDDDPIILMGWELELQQDADVVLCESIDALLPQIATEKTLLRRISCVISDFWFEKSNAFELDIVAKIRAQGYTGPIFLSSNATMPEGAGDFTGVVSKQAKSWSELKKLIERTSPVV
jgi:signal transduction histidine kinase/CheY-like chemotaxis protein